MSQSYYLQTETKGREADWSNDGEDNTAQMLVMCTKASMIWDDSWIDIEASVARNGNLCVWYSRLHVSSRWHPHSCYCTITSLSLSGPFNSWRNEIKPDNNPANAIRQCFIHALIQLEAREAFVISARGKKVQQKLNPCWTEKKRAGLIRCYSASREAEPASKPLTHLHHIVTTKWLWQLWWIRPPVVPWSEIDTDLLWAQS